MNTEPLSLNHPRPSRSTPVSVDLRAFDLGDGVSLSHPEEEEEWLEYSQTRSARVHASPDGRLFIEPGSPSRDDAQSLLHFVELNQALIPLPDTIDSEHDDCWDLSTEYSEHGFIVVGSWQLRPSVLLING